MNPLTVNAAIAISHTREEARADHRAGRRTTGRADPAIRAARSARAALERTGR